MRTHELSVQDWTKTIIIGVAVAVLTAAFTFVGFKAGVSPLPKPLGLAFAETLFARQLPLPIGLSFHLGWASSSLLSASSYFDIR